MRILLLDTLGLISAVAIGIIVIYFSLSYAVQNFILLLSFLILSVIATKYRHEEKREKGLYEHERGWQNVLSNGSIPALCVILYAATLSNNFLTAFICSLSAATADKFASELGVLSEKPISLKNLKRVRPGTSGAVTFLGTFMSFIGSLLIGVLAYFLFKFDPLLIFSIAIVGFVGSVVDTIAGIAEEEGIGNKSTSNILCTIAGMIGGYFFIHF